jgi:hypothetical protein
VSELFDEVLQRTVDEADHDARQRAEAEADMANVLQWIARIQPRRDANDLIALAPAWRTRSGRFWRRGIKTICRWQTSVGVAGGRT